MLFYHVLDQSVQYLFFPETRTNPLSVFAIFGLSSKLQVSESKRINLKIPSQDLKWIVSRCERNRNKRREEIKTGQTGRQEATAARPDPGEGQDLSKRRSG